MRLRSRKEFQRISRAKNRLVGRFICVDYRIAKTAKLGISASKRYGSSPERNRFKRLVRESFRLNYSALPLFELNIVPRQCAKRASCSDIAKELVHLLSSAKTKSL